jgi:metal-responsive CopG/Arc/MetJ family transcriptional regulator
MDAKNDRESKGAEEMDVEDAEPPIVVTVALPEEAVARIDALAARPRGGPTRAEVLQRLLRIGLDAEEKAAAEEQITN